MEQYKHNKEKWEEMLLEIGFKPEHLDMVNKYASVHTQYELINVLQSDKGFPESTLPYALRVFLQLQNEGYLDKLHSVDRVSGEGIVPIITHVTKYQFDSDDYPFLNEDAMASSFTADTAENLMKLMESKEVYIYMLFSDMKTFDNILHIFHRFGTKDKSTK